MRAVGSHRPEERERVARTIAERMERYGASTEHIAQRQVSVLTSCFVSHMRRVRRSRARYGDLRTPTGEALDARMTLFEETACAAFERAYEGELSRPTTSST